MKDIDIIHLFFERSEMAIKEASQKYQKQCMQIARSILNNVEDAEECVNDTWMCLWNQIPPDVPGSLSAYICKIVRLLSLKKLEYIKADKRNPEMMIPFEELEEILSDEHPMHSHDMTELAHILSDFLRTLSKEQRVIFVRRYFFYDSVKEIAEKYGFSESKVKSILFYTRNKLRKELKEEKK